MLSAIEPGAAARLALFSFTNQGECAYSISNGKPFPFRWKTRMHQYILFSEEISRQVSFAGQELLMASPDFTLHNFATGACLTKLKENAWIKVVQAYHQGVRQIEFCLCGLGRMCLLLSVHLGVSLFELCASGLR
jgi:hypothetical protein